MGCGASSGKEAEEKAARLEQEVRDLQQKQKELENALKDRVEAKESEPLNPLLPTELSEETKTKLQELEKESKELRQLLDQLEEKKSMAQAEREDLETELQTLHKAEQKETAEPATEATDGQEPERLTEQKEDTELEKLREKIVEVETRENQLHEEVESTQQRRLEIGASLADFEDALGRVKEPIQRGVLLGSLLEFYVENCGEVSFETSSYGNEEDWRKPLCTATKLTSRCEEANQEFRFDIARQRLRPFCPDVFAVEKLFIRPMTEERRCSAAEIWNDRPNLAEHFVSHAWAESFDHLVQGLTRFAVSLTFRESPALPQDAAASHARECSFFIHVFSNSLWSYNRQKQLEDFAVYRALKSKSLKSVLFSMSQDGSALLRAWCCTELIVAKEADQRIILNTPLGPLQDQSGPSLTMQIQQFASMLLKVVHEIDVERSMASDADRQMLMKRLDGLKFKHIRAVVSSQCLAILVQNGNVDLVKAALDLGAEADCADGLGVHPLTYAAGGEKSKVAELLLAFGARPEGATAATHVLELFSPDDEVRRKGVVELQKCPEAARQVHAEAIETAKREYARRLVDSRWEELDSEDDSVRLSVLAAIAGIGALAAPLSEDLAPLLEDSNVKIVEAACKVVVNFESIEDYLSDPNPLVRAGVLKHVVRARGRAACVSFATHFVKALSDQELQVRQAGSEALLELGDLAKDEAKALAKALKDEDWYVRCNAVQALGKLGAAALPFKEEVEICMQDESQEVHHQAEAVAAKLHELS